MDSDFLRKMRAMSIIKKELIGLGKDPDVLEGILMREYDRGGGGISEKMATVDLDDPKGIEEMMIEVLKEL